MSSPGALNTAELAVPESSDRPSTPEMDPAQLQQDRPSLDLSLRQMSAGAVAAVTAALLGSKLGVAGTLIGAALGSAVTMTASAVISHSLASAQVRLRSVRGARRSGDGGAHPVRARLRLRGPVLLAGTVVAFIAALLMITGFEAVTGSPVSGGDSGLTILGGSGGDVTTSPTTVEVTPSTTSEAVTETVTATETTTAASTGTSAVENTTPAAAVPTVSGSADPSAPSAAPSAPSTGSSANSTPSAASTTSAAPTTQP